MLANLAIDLPKLNTGPFVFGAAPQAALRQPLTFRQFIERANPRLQLYRHVEKLIAVLQRVADGELNRVMVFMPPRHGKSECISRLFSAYYLYRYPDRFVGINSYAAELATTLSRAARDNFMALGGTIRDDASAVRNWETPQGGGMWAAGAGGPITGKGFHLGIIDDPIKNAEEAASDTILNKLYEWYDSTFYTRQAPENAIVIVNTRWSDRDLSGWLLAREQDEEREPEHWHIVSMAAVKEPLPPFPATCTVEDDWREDGEPLCPERYPLARLRKFQGGQWWDALYQQRPVPPGGGIFRAEWWDVETGRNRYDVGDLTLTNQVIARWLFFDTALKDKSSNDYSACSVVELWPDYRIGLRSVWMERIQSAFLPDKITELATAANHDQKLQAVVVEDKGSGTTAIQTLRASAPEWLANMIVEFSPHGTKEYRAKQASVWCARDCVLLPYPAAGMDWYFETLDSERGQLFRFPAAAHDDFVDTLVMAIIYLENYLSTGWFARLQGGN